MLRKFLLQQRQALRQQRGQSLIIFVLAIMGIISLLGLALDLGLVYIERVKVGRATDAATLAAVTELSNNNEQAAFNRAIEYLELNGYDVGVDTEVLIRGCISGPGPGMSTGPGVGNLNEAGTWSSTLPMSATTLVTGATYVAASVQPAKATFLIDTGSYQSAPANCKPTASPALFGGNAQKVQVVGQVNVPMSFMQFFGFSQVPVEDQAIAENMTTLDIAIVFDISQSMEDQTICHDCWVRTNYTDSYPDNGYFNPLPYNKDWVKTSSQSQSIPKSTLCTAAPTPYVSGSYKYLTLEAELYSANVGNWNLSVRTGGKGFWAIQRGSRGTYLPSGISSNENSFEQGNMAGTTASQSSNVCNPSAGGIDCNVNKPGNLPVDFSAYIAARPFQTYGQAPGAIPNLNGAAYNLDCFTAGTSFGDDPPYSNLCWSNVRVANSNLYYSTTGAGDPTVPYVEYDFTPTWAGNTYVWIRAIGGNTNTRNWAGDSPDQLTGNGTAIWTWPRTIFWQGGLRPLTGTAQFGEVLESAPSSLPYYNTNTRDNRAVPTQWTWVKLGQFAWGNSTNTAYTSVVSGTQYTMRLYQGSSGYKVDKIIFTNDSSTSTPTAMLLDSNGAADVGPPASPGSATREACNVCNPAYGYSVSPWDGTADTAGVKCSCKLNKDDTANGGYGGGSKCTMVNAMQSQIVNSYLVTITASPLLTETRVVVNDLYSGLQPIRSAQEAVKTFLLGRGVEEQYRLKPGFDQVGLVSFTNVIAGSRTKLQCLRATPTNAGLDAATCYAPVITAVETVWPRSGTNIAEGLREGLEELGINAYGSGYVDSDCSATLADGQSCDRGGAAKRVLILMTDGAPNNGASACTGATGYQDYWDGLIGTEDGDFECAMYYAVQAAASGVTVYTIGIGGGANTDFLTALATGTDPHGAGPAQTWFAGTGRYFPAAKPTDLDGIFKQILTSISVRIVG